MEPFIGMIALFGFNFTPKGWAPCDGRLLPIAQNSSLFSLLGTQYGGDGIESFALPDLRGRVPIGYGQGPGLSTYIQGQMSGNEKVTLTQSQMPAHTHMLMASSQLGNQSNPTGHLLGNTGDFDKEYVSGSPDTSLNPLSIGSSGGNQPVNIVQPYLTLNYCIALYGIYPSHEQLHP